ncbi:MAG: UPF0489 family protein [Candidatus Aenigmatarchaeota archaeon]
MSQEKFTLERLEEYEGFEGKHRTLQETEVGSYEDLRLIDGEGEDNGYKNLENYVLDMEKDVFIFDDHNHALAAWIAAYNSGLFQEETKLVHVDQHLDGRAPSYKPSKFPHPPTLEEVQQCVSETGVTEFIRPARAWGIFDEVENWGIKEFKGFARKNENGIPPVKYLQEKIDGCGSFALDIDIDVFKGLREGAREKKIDEVVSELVSKRGSWISDEELDRYLSKEVDGLEAEVDYEKYYRALAEGVKKAGFTTIATSPGFIDQDKALEHIHGIFEHY